MASYYKPQQLANLEKRLRLLVERRIVSAAQAEIWIRRLKGGAARQKRASCERLKSARRKDGAAGVSFLVSLAAPFSSCFLPCLVPSGACGLATTVCFPVVRLLGRPFLKLFPSLSGSFPGV